MTIPSTIAATLQPDGVTLHIEQNLALPPGSVTVTVQSAVPRSGPSMLEVLDRIHLEQTLRGRKPMTEEEMAAEIAQMHSDDEEYEERCRQIWSQTGTGSEKKDNP